MKYGDNTVQKLHDKINRDIVGVSSKSLGKQAEEREHRKTVALVADRKIREVPNSFP